ncbi:type 1 glutamine amidotransferase [Cochlodiniinecator piscidefendens]|uniref:type 1 glutamine amidotransferase n=1 Tax=Cochlodiniinecator piscidefendens TaxID=2715756 RepID=UPI001407BD98|nr:type 1 glutamine amidotransferase [Cochlodiniinecator piscidefendens]
MKLGILQCGHVSQDTAEKHGTLPQLFETMLAGHDFTFQSWDVENMEFPTSVSDADGWLLTGSKHGAYEDHPFIAPLCEFIRQSYDARIPLVGICFGHQIIARAMGGTVEKFDKGWGLGPQTYDYNGHGKVTLNAWHQDQVTKAPSSATPILSSDFCENAALLYDQNRALTIQPHPEFGPEVIGDFVAARRGTADYCDDAMQRALDLAHVPLSNAYLATEIATFLKSARTT